MDRSKGLDRLVSESLWDILVIGGGATGLGAALDAASRGHSVALIESQDFASGTSSRSTKLVHGGVRYLKQGNLSLVRGALRERGLLFQNAPHLVKPLPFIIPSRHWPERTYFATGLRFYDWLAGGLGIRKTRALNQAETLKAIPCLATGKLYGGVQYWDGQFDDARLAIDLATTTWEYGGLALNYVRADELIMEKGRIAGAVCSDQLGNRSFDIRARCVINATGVFSDEIRRMDNPQARGIITASQGAHIVLDQERLPMKSALIVPKTSDGRVLFAIPWINRVIIGTTDTPVDSIQKRPKPFTEEIGFILDNARHYLSVEIESSDIKSAYAGLRPLVNLNPKGGETSQISRDHHIEISDTGLITIAGGKWTTYRKMGEDVIDKAEESAELEARSCQTENLKIQSHFPDTESQRLHADLPYTSDQLQTSIDQEMAMTIEDILARRLRATVLDNKASLELANFAADRLIAADRLREEDKARAIDEFKADNRVDLNSLPSLAKPHSR